MPAASRWKHSLRASSPPIAGSTYAKIIVLRPDGTEGEYSVVELPCFASVLAFNANGEVVLVGLWRHVHARFACEQPPGGPESSDAAPLETAKRELFEETA